MGYYYSIQGTDWLLAPIYFIIIYLFANNYKKKHIEDKPYFKYFLSGLYAKLVGAFFVTIIYHFYYSGGDTINYFHSSKVLLNVAGKDFSTFISILFDNRTMENYSVFTGKTKWPLYWTDDSAFAVVRYTTGFTFLGMRHFIPTALLLAATAYAGIWRLFTVFAELYPKYTKLFAIAILFMPSCVFWGSGILKDTYTFSLICMLVYIFHKFLNKKSSLKYIIGIIVFSYLTITLKPYLFITFAISCLAWYSVGRVQKIENKALRHILFPLLVLVMFSGGMFLYQQYGYVLGEHYSSFDIMFERAVIIQDDLKQDYYGGNTFDIGPFEASFTGILKKMPEAITAGLLRPFLWEVRSPFMLLSALENIFFLFFVLYLLLRVGVFGLIRNLFSKPNIILFCFIFAISLSFTVGLTTSNFGSLVRYKIPAIPFFLSMLIVMYIIKKEKKEEMENTDKPAAKSKKKYSAVPEHLKEI